MGLDTIYTFKTPPAYHQWYSGQVSTGEPTRWTVTIADWLRAEMQRFLTIIGPTRWISSCHQRFTKLGERQIVSRSSFLMTPTVTLETKCWEGDWKRILEGDRLRLLAERNAYAFSERILMINNVKNLSVVSKCAERAMQQGSITKYVIVEEHAAEALEFFSISRESLGIGYPYSIAELVGIFLCRSDFLLHYAGDCMPAPPVIGCPARCV